MKKHFLSLLAILSFFTSAAAFTISGRVTDNQGEGLPFASVYIKGTSKGTTTNVDGYYSLELSPGKYEMAYRYIGFQLYVETLDLSTGNIKKDVKLQPENIQLKEITISASAEDPAYPIIRQAIKKRKYYLDQVESFSADVYIKGIERIKKFPKKFFGQELSADMLGIIDTSSGIVYLSESVSKFNYRKPDVKEEMISSKVSGSNQAFSYNQASDMLFNFYENLITVDNLSDRGFVSPISSNALFYYKYHLLGSFKENGFTINKIQVIPIRKNDPVFRGVIYIMDDSWRIYSTELFLTKDANIDFVDTLYIKQVHSAIEKDIWLPISNRFDFDFKFMGIKGNGMFVGVSSNYIINPDFPKKFFSNEVMKVKDDANKKDSAYWKESRPVPLTKEETTDYRRRDSLETIHKSKPYLDSLDKKTNKFNWSDAIFGYSYSRRFKKDVIYFTGPLQTFQFNSVEGFNISLGGGYFKRFENRKSYSINPALHYGFASQQFTARVSADYNFNPKRFAKAELSGGTENVQYAAKAIPPLVNTLYSLIDGQNYMKLYHRDFAEASIREELVNGVYLNSGLEYSRRSALVNHTDFNLNRNYAQFTSNNPVNPSDDSPAFAPNQALTLNLELKLVYRQKYYTRPNSKIIIGSRYPSLILGYRKGMADVSYDLVKAGLEDEMKLGLLGNSRYSVSAGKFVNSQSIYFMDYQHFLGNRTNLTDDELSRFNVMPYYLYSTSNYFLQAHYEHNFGGFILNKFPLIRKLKFKEIVSVHYLHTDKISQYVELNIGVQRGVIPFRIQFVTSFADKQKASARFQLSIPF